LFFSETPGRGSEIPARIEAIESDQTALENRIESLVEEVKERLKSLEESVPSRTLGQRINITALRLQLQQIEKEDISQLYRRRRTNDMQRSVNEFKEQVNKFISSFNSLMDSMQPQAPAEAPVAAEAPVVAEAPDALPESIEELDFSDLNNRPKWI
jgi:flagellar capping protein FliD